jgi:hypothetical protein
MIVFVECQGFPGHSTAQFILNLPGSLLYAPLFTLYSLSQVQVASFLSLLALSLLYWSPVLYLLAFRRAARLERKHARMTTRCSGRAAERDR